MSRDPLETQKTWWLTARLGILFEHVSPCSQLISSSSRQNTQHKWEMTSVHVFRITPINSGEPPTAAPSSTAHWELQGLHGAVLILATADPCRAWLCPRQAVHPWASYSPSLIPQCSMWLETTQGIMCTRCSNTCLLLAWYPVRGQRKTNASSLLVPRLLLTTKWVSPQWQRLSRGASQVTGMIKYTFSFITHRRASWLFV